MAPYLTLAQFRARTIMPGTDVDAVEASAPGFILSKLTAKSRWIDARLSKRYAVPFASPFPDAVCDWLARIVTLSAYLRRGVDPNDEQFVALKEDAERAEAEIAEAATAETGLYELPLINTTSANGVTRGGTSVYSEASPYVWQDVQRERGRNEDRNGGGTI